MSTAEAHTDYDSEDSELAVPLDALLSNAANGARRVLPGPEYVSLVQGLLRHPRAVSARLGNLGAELARITAGMSDAAPSKRDRRFADEAWSGNPVLRRMLQAYLATGERAHQLLDELDLDERAERRLRLQLDNVIDALSPSNNPLLNPTAIKAVLDTGGANLVQGFKHFATDMSQRPRVPSMVDTTSFEVGENIACTPGAVVLRTPLFELIQYTPTTGKVRQTPVLLVPPMINKFYVLDLAPKRSMVEYLVGTGQQVFVVSWRNPNARHSAWGLQKYVEAVIAAMDATREVAGSEQVVLHGTCAGGIVSAITAAHLSAVGRGDELAALVLAVTVLDQARAGTSTAIMSKRRAEIAKSLSKRVGYLDGRLLSEMFAWMRPNDLIWNYWVNNYLLGKRPPAFDVLFWNADSTRMPAALHHDFLDMSMDNLLADPGSLTVLGTEIDLASVTVDTYLIGGETDHITPWQSCYRSTNLLGGDCRFILSTSGHIAALVNPPENEKSSFRTAPAESEVPEEWAETTEKSTGSWWVDYAHWLESRTGAQRNAPKSLGRGRLQPIGDAPGTYVLDT